MKKSVYTKKSSYLLIDLRKFNEILKKGVTYDNIKSHKKRGLDLASRRYSFGKTTERVKLIPYRLLRITQFV